MIAPGLIPGLTRSRRPRRNAELPARLAPAASPRHAGDGAFRAEPDAALPPNIRANTLLPAELIQPGEIIILLLKPSPWFILLESLRSVAVVVAGIILALAATNFFAGLGVRRRDLAAVAVVILGVRLFWQFLEWLGRVYVLTDRRIIRVRGVIRIQVFEAQLKQIQHTVTSFSARERLFALGTIGFATAASGMVEVQWRMIDHPLEVHQAVIKALNRYR